jgi:hypothetical protein
VPGIGIFSCSQQASQIAKSQAAFDLQNRSSHFTGILDRGTDREHSDLDPREDSPTKRIDVNPARHSVLYESPEKVILSGPHGIAAITGSRVGKMEDFISPLDGSDGSNLSPTQENDPAVYIRLQQELALAPDSQSSSQPRIGATQETAIHAGSAPTAQGTGISYAVNDTGHLTLDYQPPPSPPLHDSFDETEVGEVSSGRLRSHLFNGALLHPHTPAQTKLVIGNPGTVMRPSQMFAETQPSRGSRDLHLLPPSSSRPSPDLFNQYQSPKHFTSSPLVRRVGKTQSEKATDYDVSSSPEPSQPEGDGNHDIGPRHPLSERMDVLANARGESPFSGNLIHQNFPAPFDVYTTRKESQERRRRQARVFNDASESSDDGFSDNEAELNRRAKRRKEEAARELAVISTSRPGSAGKDIVEVPSTSTGRRRSLGEKYEAQCSGFDARDTQPEATIVDSQSAPTGVRAFSVGEATHVMKEDELSQSDPRTFHHQDRSQEDSAHSLKTADDESSGQLPALEQNEDSEATESEREGSKSPVRQHIMSQVPSNIAELRTPAIHKKLPYVDGDTIVPETSPSEPHLQRYGDIVSQTPPVVSAEEVDDAFNPFTQDMEFNNLIQSPSPRRTRSSRNTQPSMPTSDANVEAGSEVIEKRRATGSAEINASPSTAYQFGKADAAGLVPIEADSEDLSEYVTAPTSLPAQSTSTQKVHSKPRADNAKKSTRALNKICLPKEIEQVSEVSLTDTGMVGVEAGIPDVKQASVLPDGIEASPQVPTSFSHEDSNEDSHGDDVAQRAAAAENSGLGPAEVYQANSSKASSRPTKKSVRQSRAGSGKIVDVAPVNLAAKPSEVLPNRLRSATQLRGSSRALRRLLDESSAAPTTPTPTHVTPTPTVQKVTRSSRRSSTNCKFFINCQVIETITC